MAERRPRIDKGKKRTEGEGVVFSFRLHSIKDADAIQAIEDWRTKGKSVRDVMLMGLDRLSDNPPVETSGDEALDTFYALLERLEETVERLNELGIEAKPKRTTSKKSDLPLDYLANLGKAVQSE